MGKSGLYLNYWNIGFDPMEEVLAEVPLWVPLPFLHYYLHNETILEKIGNLLGQFVIVTKGTELKHNVAYARIFIKENLDLGFLDVIKLNIGGYQHI